MEIKIFIVYILDAFALTCLSEFFIKCVYV